MTFVRSEHELFTQFNSSCVVIHYLTPLIICYTTCFNAQGDSIKTVLQQIFILLCFYFTIDFQVVCVQLALAVFSNNSNYVIDFDGVEKPKDLYSTLLLVYVLGLSGCVAI